MIINFFYLIFFSIIILGYGLLLSRLLKESSSNLIVVFVYGFFILSIVSSVVVIFTALVPVIKILVWIGGLLLFLFFFVKKKNVSESFGGPLWLKVIYLIGGFIFLLTKISSPSEIMDEGYQYINLYHMFEQVGVSVGIGNLLPHLTLNSNWHLLNAVCNPQGILIDFPLYELNGVLGLIIFLLSYQGAVALLHNAPAISSIIKLFSPLFLFRNQLTGGGTDVVVYIFGVVLVTLLLDNINERSQRINSAVLLIIMPVLMITIKITSLPLILISASVISFIALKNKPIEVVPVAALCFILLSLWLIRNVMLSGYLVSAIAFMPFDVSWKIGPSAISTLSSKTQFGIFAHPDISSISYFKKWILAFPTVQRIIVELSFLMTIFYGYNLISKILSRSILFLELVFYCVLILGFFTWFFTISEFRYGAFYHFFNLLFLLSFFLIRIQSRFDVIKYVFLISFFIGLLFQVNRNVQEFPFLSYHITVPAMNPSVKFDVVKMNDTQIYVPTSYAEAITNKEIFYYNMSQDLYSKPGCWNTPFPCIIK